MLLISFDRSIYLSRSVLTLVMLLSFSVIFLRSLCDLMIKVFSSLTITTDAKSYAGELSCSTNTNAVNVIIQRINE